jgi:hypothetical protein
VPFGHGRQFGAHLNPVVDAALGGWELNSIITANTGTPLNVSYAPNSAQDVTGLTNDYRGEAILRPNVSGSAVSQTFSQSINS